MLRTTPSWCEGWKHDNTSQQSDVSPQPLTQLVEASWGNVEETLHD